MGLDFYFDINAAGIAQCPDVEFPVCDWSGSQKTVSGYIYREGLDLDMDQVKEELEMLSQEEVTINENIVSIGGFGFPEGFQPSIGIFSSALCKPIVQRTYPEFASFRAGRYSLLVFMLSGIDLFNDGFTPEQVKLIASALEANQFDPSWENGVFNFEACNLTFNQVATVFSKRTYAHVFTALTGAVHQDVNFDVFRVTEREYEGLKAMFRMFADLNCGGYSCY
jgi:hypothetical protein